LTAAARANQTTFYNTTTGSYENTPTYPDQFYTVPIGTAWLDIQLWGGGGGGNHLGPNGGAYGGAGGWVSLAIPINVSLPNGQTISAGETIGYEVGSGGGDATITPSGGIGNGGNGGSGGGGGGGATFLWLGNNNSTLLAVAAGGGGGFLDYYSNDGGSGGGLVGSTNQDATDSYRTTPGIEPLQAANPAPESVYLEALFTAQARVNILKAEALTDWEEEAVVQGIMEVELESNWEALVDHRM
jgi:hypothetical protein